MTKQEHDLMMQLTGALFQLSMALFQILRSREVATVDDLPVFSALVEEGKASGEFVELYRELARKCGVRLP